MIDCPEIRKTYEKMFDVFYRQFHDYNKAWDYMIDFITVDNCPPMLEQMDHKFEWYFEDEEFASKIKDVYDLQLLKSDRHDYLGDLYVDNQSQLTKSFKGQYLTPDNVIEAIVQMTVGETENEVNILDPCVGTGRFLIIANKYAPNANLFGVDIDLRALRIAFANCALHNISARFLHANSLKHETDISRPEGIYNWQYANRWDSCWDELKLMSTSTPSVEDANGLKVSEKVAQLKLESFG